MKSRNDTFHISKYTVPEVSTVLNSFITQERSILKRSVRFIYQDGDVSQVCIYWNSATQTLYCLGTDDDDNRFLTLKHIFTTYMSWTKLSCWCKDSRLSKVRPYFVLLLWFDTLTVYGVKHYKLILGTFS